MQEGSKFGPYQLIKRIAFGGMAEIHLAKATGIGGFEKLLALKVIHPKFSEDQEFIDMLVDEAKIAVQLSHVNVGQIFDLGHIDGTYYIAMEFIDGKDLYQLLVKCSELDIQIPFDVIAFIAMETCAGLQYAHTKSDNYGRPLELIHRDISPQNVLISYDGEVKIVDFGIAKASQRSRETESGVIKGKFFYMSPEQAWGDDIDGRTDIFSTGICLYEMITGQMLYNEDKALALLDMVRRAEIPDMRALRPDLPPQLEQITRKALAREREDRYQSAGALQGALSGFVYGNWPGFNRRRVADFMRRVFGDNRFVLPMPGDQPPPEVKDHEMPLPDLSSGGDSSLRMEAGDFPAAEVGQHSVIFDLGAAEAARGFPHAGRAEAGDEDRTIATPYDASEDDLPEYLREVEEAEDERTITEAVWSSIGDMDDDGERTMAMSSIPDELSGLAQEPPTNMYDAAALARAAPQAAGGMEQTRALMSPGRRAEPTPAAPPDAQMESTRALMSPVARAAPQPVASDARAAPTPIAPPPGHGVPSGAPAAPTPIMASGSQPRVAPVLASGSQPRVAPAPVRPAPSSPQPAMRSHSAMPSLKPSDVGTISVADRPRRGPDVKALLGKLLNPVGISVLVVVLLLGYGAFAFLPTLFAEAPPTQATLVVESVPDGARVIVDGTDTGQTTRATVEGLTIGAAHTIKLQRKGYEDLEETIQIRPEDAAASGDGPAEVERRFFLRRAKRTLSVKSDPAGAEVYFKGRWLGETPLSTTDIDRTEDKMVLTVRKPGHTEVRVTVEWGDETEQAVEAKLEPSKK